MAELTPEEQFSALRQQLLLLQQLRRQTYGLQNVDPGVEAAPGAVAAAAARAPEQVQQPAPGAAAPAAPAVAAGRSQAAADSISAAQRVLASSEQRDIEAVVKGLQVQLPAAPVSFKSSGETRDTERLQLMQRNLMQHQHHLVRQREQLQQQQLLLFQRSQERHVPPPSLAQLFADLHESRQQQQQQQQQGGGGSRAKDELQDARFEYVRTAALPPGRLLSGGPQGFDSEGCVRWRPQRRREGLLAQRAASRPSTRAAVDNSSDAEEPSHSHMQHEGHLQPRQASNPRGGVRKRAHLCWGDKRRMLRAVALLDTETVFHNTLRSLQCLNNRQHNSLNALEDRGAGGGAPAVGCDAKEEDIRQQGPRGVPGGPGGSGSPPGPPEPSNGRVMQVHGEPLLPAALFTGLSSGSLWRCCLRVTLSARRCAIRTRRSWRALVPLFPRRSAYSPSALLSDDDVLAYIPIGPRTSAPAARGAAAADTDEAFKTPREPFAAPGFYLLSDDQGGRWVAAWAVAADRQGGLKQQFVPLENAEEGSGSNASRDKRHKSSQQQQQQQQEGCSEQQALRQDPLHAVYMEIGPQMAKRLKALEVWYAQQAESPLTPQQLTTLTIEKYVSGFCKYAEELVGCLEKLIETRHPPLHYRKKAVQGCGCHCSICLGLPCRVRLAWRRQLLAFEVAVDKTVVDRHHSDSSEEDENAEGTESYGRVARLAAASRNRKGRWEWCRQCPLGCRMEFCLILHELYQPFTLTRLGLRSALIQVLLRLRRYVSLSPRAVQFLMKRVNQIRLSATPGRETCCEAAGTAAAAAAAAAAKDDAEGAKLHRRHSWDLRDWADICWSRRHHDRHKRPFIPNKVTVSNDLDSSILRLAALSSPLRQPVGDAEAHGEPPRMSSAADGETCSSFPLLPETCDSMLVAQFAAEQLRQLVRHMPLGQDVKGEAAAGGLEPHVARAAVATALGVGGSCQEAEVEGIKHSQVSFPASLASSQVPSACSTPPRQSSRPPIGRCFALPRNTSSLQPPRPAEGMPGDSPPSSPLECQLHTHCDGTARARRGRGSERDDWGRSGGYGAESFAVDESSPRRLRRMHRGRLTSEETLLPPPRQVEIARRVTPLVPWWWDEYIRTGTQPRGKEGLSAEGNNNNDCLSDGSSVSVSSTISLTSAPHLFRLPYDDGHRRGASYSSTEGSGSSWQDPEAATTAAVGRLSESADRDFDAHTSHSLALLSQLTGGMKKASLGGIDDADGGGPAIGVIQAAAQLVDSFDFWFPDIETHSAAASLTDSQSRCVLQPEGDWGSAGAAEGSGVAAARKGKQGFNKGGGGASASDLLEPADSQSLLTFVSAMLETPAEGKVDCVEGFEVLEGVIGLLFSSTDPQTDDSTQPPVDAGAVGSTQNAQEGLPCLGDARQSTPAGPATAVEGLGATKTEDQQSAVSWPRGAGARSTSTPPGFIDMSASTPLLRSLAASAAPPVESSQGKLAVDDFYANPIQKRAVSFRDIHEPFDKDYSDTHIRLKPLRVFGLRQQRHGRHRRRSLRHSPQSSGSSSRCSSPAPSLAQGAAGLIHRRPLQSSSSKGRLGGLGSFGERSGTTRIGGRRVVVRSMEGRSTWAPKEASVGGLSDFSLSRCSMSVDSSISSRGMSVCSRATSNGGSASDASLQPQVTHQGHSNAEVPSRHRRGRSRPPPGGRGGTGSTSTPTGVYLDVARKLWRCQWRENGRFKTKSFPLNQYKTLKEARRACVIFRCLMGGWEVQPAWLGEDDDGDEADASEPSEGPAAPAREETAAPDVHGGEEQKAAEG